MKTEIFSSPSLYLDVCIGPANPVQSGQRSFIAVGRITTYVDEGDMTIFNVTTPPHLLAPGIVERWVALGDDGLFHINTYGEGNGMLPMLNDQLAGALWHGTATILH